MAVWAYECRPCAGRGEWWIDRLWVDELPPEVQVLRVQAGGGWACGIVDRSRPVAVDLTLLREARVADADDCPDCARQLAALAAAPRPAPAPATTATDVVHPAQAADESGRGASSQIQAAAIALQGQPMLVVLVGLDLVQNPGEADMLAADLQSRFGGVAVVLMGQQDDGTPVYHGPAALLDLLADLPVDRLPWKAYPLR